MDAGRKRELEEALGKLQGDPNAIPWAQRRALAQSLGDHLSATEPPETLLVLVDLLASDPKWEIRREIANLLVLVPEDRLSRLAAKLSEDANSFVQKAAERGLDRRRKGKRDARRRRRGIDDLADEYALMEELHGTLAASKARQIGERLYDVLVGAAVHNMRGVLTPIKSSTEKLLAALAGDRLDQGTLSKHLSRIDESVLFLERLLDDTRAFSQPMPAERRRERLVDLLNQAVALARENFGATGHDPNAVNVEIYVPEGITCTASRHQIVVAFTNVVQNAFEAFVTSTESAGQCRVRIDAEVTENDDVRIVIEDNGVGFGRDDLRQIRQFIPGQRTLKHHGTGFGLPTAKRYLEAHGGSVEIDSREDEGTRVTITLPLEYEQESDE